MVREFELLGGDLDLCVNTRLEDGPNLVSKITADLIVSMFRTRAVSLRSVLETIKRFFPATVQIQKDSVIPPEVCTFVETYVHRCRRIVLQK